MKKQKWSNFYGAVFAGVTLECVALCIKHVRKKYGEKRSGFSVDYQGIAEYAFDKFILNNDKLLASVGEKLNAAENRKGVEE
ncbi:MAG: hypothetical protein K1V97_04940 [Lachnospiraceae bacterium]